MDLRFSEEDEAFRREIAGWLAEQLEASSARSAGAGGRRTSTPSSTSGSPGATPRRGGMDLRRVAGRSTAAAGSPSPRVIFYEEYARAGGPGRVGHIGETLLGPTLIAFGSDEQKRRFLRRSSDAKSSGVKDTRSRMRARISPTCRRRDASRATSGSSTARRWTSNAGWSDWCFVLCRTEAGRSGHQALSYLLVPMKQPGSTSVRSCN